MKAVPANVFRLMGLCVCSMLVGLSCGMQQPSYSRNPAIRLPVVEGIALRGQSNGDRRESWPTQQGLPKAIPKGSLMQPYVPKAIPKGSKRDQLQLLMQQAVSTAKSKGWKRKLLTYGASAVVSGAGNLIEAGAAKYKAEKIHGLLMAFYPNRADYKAYLKSQWVDGHITTPGSALLYAAGKKSTKALRKSVIGVTKAAADVALTGSGATVGSIFPGAGTILGGAIGHLGAQLLVAPSVFVGDRLKRGLKRGWKGLVGRLGMHRAEAAKVLVEAAAYRPFTKEGELAKDGLRIIMDVEEVPCLENKADCGPAELMDLVANVAKRLRSN